MGQITEPGIYPEFPEAAYYADPCPRPSLSQSVAKVLLDQSPLHAWYAHPRLNPDYRPDDDTKYDVGNIAHALMIGRGKDIVVIEGADDWRKPANREMRDDLARQGRLGVLAKNYARADRMVNAAREQLEHRDLGHLFRDGDGEVVLAWERHGTWFRQMVDWLTPDRRIFADYKTTDMSAAPHGLGRMMVNAGWPVQAAFAEGGLDALDPPNAGRREFLFVVQEAEAPYQINVVRMSEAALTMGRKQVERAAQVWAECLAHNVFPGYPAQIVEPEYPGWHEQQWLDREIQTAARERMPSDLLAAG